MSLRSILLGDFLLELLQGVLSPERKLLEWICQLGWEVFGKDTNFKGMPFFASEDARCEHIIPVLDEFLRFCSMVGTLFMLEGFEQDPAAVTFFLGYNGPSLFAKAVKALLSVPAPKPGDEQVLADHVADVLRTSASGKVLRPKMREMLSKIHTDQPDLGDLLDASKLVPNLKTGLRQGESKEFEFSLVQKVVEFVERLTSGDSSMTTAVSTKNVAILREAMQPFEKDPKVLAVQGRLMAFVTEHNKSIAEMDLLDWAKSVIEKYKAKADAADLIDPEELKKVLSKCGSSAAIFKDEVRTACTDAIHLGIHELLSEDRFHFQGWGQTFTLPN